MKIETIKTETLIPYARNSRTHADFQIQQIAGSIREFGFTNPVLIDADNGIIAGHGRVMAAGKLGMDKVPCIRLSHLTETQRRAYIIADNKLALNAGWDEELLGLELADLAALDFDMDLIGFGEDELAALMAETTEGETDPDDVPEPPVDPVSVLGDVWVMGKHRLLCGDSTSIDAVEKLMDGGKADMMFTDPPYGFNYIKKSDGAFIKNDGPEFEKIIAEAIGMVQVDTAYICGDVKTAAAFLRATSYLGNPKNCIIWVKPIQHRMHRYEPCHELIWYWGDNGSPFYGANVFEAKREISQFHPTIKPVELVEYCLCSHNDKRLVVDLFGGSGSTLIACEKTGRDCRMMELDPKYCDVIVTRWQAFAGKQAIHEASGKTFDEMKASNP